MPSKRVHNDNLPGVQSLLEHEKMLNNTNVGACPSLDSGGNNGRKGIKDFHEVE